MNGKRHTFVKLPFPMVLTRHSFFVTMMIHSMYQSIMLMETTVQAQV